MPHDRNKLFVTNAIKREDIARDLNEYFETFCDDRENQKQLPVHHSATFCLDDDRLTDEICQWYAEKIGNVDMEQMDFDDVQEAVDNIKHDCLVKIGMIKDTDNLEGLFLVSDGTTETQPGRCLVTNARTTKELLVVVAGFASRNNIPSDEITINKLGEPMSLTMLQRLIDRR